MHQVKLETAKPGLSNVLSGSTKDYRQTPDSKSTIESTHQQNEPNKPRDRRKAHNTCIYFGSRYKGLTLNSNCEVEAVQRGYG
jgi:hypothetical protein